MERILVNNTLELRKHQTELEQKLKVKIAIKGKQVTFSGESLDEYEASIIFDAISFGFSPKVALMLKDEDTVFRKINIKSVTNRKNIALVRARLIGTDGRTRRTLEQLGDCRIMIKDNEVGIIGPAEDIEEATTGVESLIRGSKQSNVYGYLERRNRERKEQKWNDR